MNEYFLIKQLGIISKILEHTLYTVYIFFVFSFIYFIIATRMYLLIIKQPIITHHFISIYNFIPPPSPCPPTSSSTSNSKTGSLTTPSCSKIANYSIRSTNNPVRKASLTSTYSKSVNPDLKAVHRRRLPSSHQ